MKTRNAFPALTICVLSALTIPMLITPHKAEAESITDCRQLVAGTYLLSNSGDFGSFRSIVTFTQDGNFSGIASIQSSAPTSGQTFSNTQGSWRCISKTEITATGLNFSYPTETLPGNFIRSDFQARFDPKAGTVQATVIQRFFALNADPLTGDAPVAGRSTFTGQRVITGANVLDSVVTHD